MKEYAVAGRSHTFRVNNLSRDMLSNLEISVKMVKCRKPCWCNICRRQIGQGEMALKTVQFTKNRNFAYLYNNYCDECYREVQ